MRSIISDRFNRYIVECKYDRIWVITGGKTWFNRYIVECKYSLYSRTTWDGTDLIDT